MRIGTELLEGGIRVTVPDFTAAWVLTYHNEHGLMNWLTSQVKEH